MANGNLTKKEPKIVENDHKSLKKIQKSSKRAKNCQKWPKKPTNLDFKKLEKTQQT